jgi:Rad3-related DNA helicase
MLWNLRENQKPLRPLEYSNGKSQLDVVNEVNDAFNGSKFVLLDGICGTGKSPIALHCCANFGKSIIVVPTKHLQDQYSNDYSKRMSVANLKIQFLKGRGNFKCKREDVYCNTSTLPCITRMKGGEKRQDMCNCKFWSPIYAPDVAKVIVDEKKSKGVSNIELKTYQSPTGPKCQVVRTPACDYHAQYFSFWDDTNVIAMNSRIWELMIAKKPAAELEVIDEYDEYFDSLYFDEILSASRIEKFYPSEDDADSSRDVLKLYKSKMRLAEEIEALVTSMDEPMVWDFIEKMRDFFIGVMKQHEGDLTVEGFVNRLGVCLDNRHECDLDFDQRTFGSNEKAVHIIMPNPFVVIQRLFKNSKRVLLMSATPHSDKVLSSFFHLDPKAVRAETVQPGILYLMKPDMMYVNYSNWSKKDFQDRYYDSYRKILASIPKDERTLIQSHSLKYSGQMAKEFSIRVDSSQSDLYGGRGAFNEWLHGDFKTLISTKCKRGIDLKDDLCRNIIIDKMPYPDRNDRKFKSIERRFPAMFNEIYSDIARRSLIQLIARGLRHKDDWVRVYTPDLTAYNNIKRLGVFNIREMGLGSAHSKDSDITRFTKASEMNKK